MEKYDPSIIEPKWQARWEKGRLYQTPSKSSKKKFYILDMFPYPSAEGLHVGHFKGYTATDVIARYLRMKGYNVLHPMGWDAFGLPAENYAIRTGVHPAISTKRNITRIKEQMVKAGFSYDWSKELNTTDPAYYRWTQWIFLKMFEAGLTYEAKAPINWCPKDKTGLANEEVVNGKCERCGAKVIKKEIRQWILKITAYADRLLKDLEGLDWPQAIVEMQKNWIGKSVGSKIKFQIANSKFLIEVFTTRPDTLFGATYMVIAPEHNLIWQLNDKIANFEVVKKYIDMARQKSDLERQETKEKRGVKLEGIQAINPVNYKKIPVFTADYVLSTYGTGAIMAVPAHDERDFEFAKKYNLPIKPVILPQRIYIDENAQSYYQKRTNIHQKILLELANIANKNNKKLFIQGGWAVAIQVGKGFRENEDLDILILDRDLEWWKKELQTLGLKLSTMFSEGKNETYYFQAIKQDTHIDIGVIKVENDKVISLAEKTPKEYNFSFKDLFEKKTFENTPIWVMSKQALYRIKKELVVVKEIRWKELSDFVMLGLESYTGEGILINSGEFSGIQSGEARVKITNSLEDKKLGKKEVAYKLRDWIFSRQRYWGEPIPIIHCKKCGTVPLQENDLPLKLPDVEKWKPSGTGESPLAAIDDWVNTTCWKCGGPAKRETNTMPQWAGSCWYYLRFCDPKNKKALIDKKLEKYFMPVNWYVGGAEHAVLHLLYARFWHKFLYDLGVVSTKEPFTKLRNVGVVLGPNGRRMSKSRGNVIIPDEICKKYGADTLRLYECFMGPFDQIIAWSPASVDGVWRFLNRVWSLVLETRYKKQETRSKELEIALNKLIKKVEEDILAMKFNTAVAAMMEFLNFAQKSNGVNSSIMKQFIILIAPFAPHVAEELWVKLGGKYSVHSQSWPKTIKDLTESLEKTIVVQVNGKLRDKINILGQVKDVELKDKILKLEKVKKHLNGKKIKIVIIVPGRLVNIVTSQ